MSIYDDVTAALAALKTALATIPGPIDQASPSMLAPAILAAQDAVAAIDAAIAWTDALVDTSGVYGIAAGVPAPQLAMRLLTQQSVLGNIAVLMVQKGAVGRILVNLGIFPG